MPQIDNKCQVLKPKLSDQRNTEDNNQYKEKFQSKYLYFCTLGALLADDIELLVFICHIQYVNSICVTIKLATSGLFY